jgi:putative hemolysin
VNNVSIREITNAPQYQGVVLLLVQCITVMEGRFFGGRQIEAALWDGIQQYHVKPAKKTKEETEAEQQARLERFAAEIEAQEAPELEPPVPLAEPV